jgi:predicted  nucleic acid-binding Zn ribbon protein
MLANDQRGATVQVVELTFKSAAKWAGDASEWGAPVDLIDTLISCWRNRGQVLGREHPIADASPTYRVTVLLPEPTALNDEHDCPYGLRVRERLRVSGITGPRVTPKEPMPQDGVCACRSQSHLILYTTYVRLASCLSCGDCFRPVPLYRVPYEQSTPDRSALHDRLMNWQSNYQACDRLQMNCQVGEAFGLREMGQHTSALSRQGLEICRDISRLSGVPTYYALHRYRHNARAAIEQKRRCPGCAGDWKLPEQAHLFHFKCDTCRLLSIMAP